MNITKKQFKQYKEVQESGKTNMFNLKAVQALSGLERDTIKEIMKNYEELKEKYLN